MKQYTTFAETEALLRTAINLICHSTKDIGTATCIFYRFHSSAIPGSAIIMSLNILVYSVRVSAMM